MDGLICAINGFESSPHTVMEVKHSNKRVEKSYNLENGTERIHILFLRPIAYENTKPHPKYMVDYSDKLLPHQLYFTPLTHINVCM